jgi:hypothetical protein
LQNEGISLKREEPEWLDLPAMMRIPVSSPAVLGRLKDFCKPYDFVLAPVVRDGDSNLDEEANKPILVTRFSKNSEEWPTATYFNVRTGKPCRITTGESTGKGVIAVRSYRSVLNAYVNNAESKFDGPDGKQCCSWTRGMLQRTHIVAGEHRYCGKEIKRKLEQGPVDHEVEFKCKVYENGRVAAGPETLRQLASFSERQISKRTGVHRHTIRLIRHGKGVKRSTYEKVINFSESEHRRGCLTLISANLLFRSLNVRGYTGTRWTHLIIHMPYRDPARRAAWMWEYRKRKRVGQTGALASPQSPCSNVRAPKPSELSRPTIERPAPQPASPNARFIRKAARSGFKTALDVAQSFPFGVLASQVCPYCYNTGYSSLGTRCSYCRSEER